MKTIRIGFLAVALTVLASTLALTQSGQDLFQQALVKEQADGDLRAAIAMYQRIVRDFAGDRVLAAKALVQMGRCHEKLGSQDARKAYEQVLKEYADQAEAAGYARARLVAMRQPPPEAGEPTIRARRLLAGPYDDTVEFSGGPTPDGRSLVYVDSTGMNLAIRNLETGASRLITNRGSEKGYMAYFEIVSPDGRRVAYAWEPQVSPEQPRTELWVVGMDGSGDRLLRKERFIYPGSWSRDGRHIAAVIRRTEDLDTEIAWISVEDGSKTTLTTFHYPRRFYPGLSHSPDDRFVAVGFPVEEDSARRDISLLSTKGGSVLPLVDHPADDTLIGWIPGTNDVLFSSDRSGNRDLWAIRVGEDGRSGAPRPVRRGIGEMSAMGFTREGSLFYSVYTLQYNIFIAPFDESSGQVKVNEAKPLGGRGSNMRPSWSPNGQYLAFARRRPTLSGRGVEGRDFEEIVYVLDTKTGEERAIAEHIAPATVPAPSWFPDGRSLLVLGIPQNAAAGSASKVPSAVYRIDLATGGATRLFEFPPTTNWWYGKGLIASPGGDGVIYDHDGRLVLRQLQSGKEEELYRHPDLAPAMCLSPDGSELAFVIRRTARSGVQSQAPAGDTRLMIMPSRGGEARELATAEAPIPLSQLAWTSDGRHILFVRRDKNGAALMRVPRQGGKAERLWEIQERMPGFSPSPDGRRVAYFTQENEAEIWVLENIKDALVRQR
ncbi:MAG: PD40 domain-containing protein [Acidobacteria bacterium]|nr:PD40 domain-containing protein [Acidobacteriota bacterium]